MPHWLVVIRNRLLSLTTFAVFATLFAGITIGVASQFKSVELGGLVGIAVAFSVVYWTAKNIRWYDAVAKRWKAEEDQ